MACNRRRSASTSNAAVGHASAEPGQRLDEQRRDRPVAVPLAIRRDDVPRRDVRRRRARSPPRRPSCTRPTARGCRGRRGCTSSASSGRPGARADAPSARRREMCRKHFTTVVPVRRERLLEALDRAVAPRPGPPVGELQDADGHDVLVVRAVEDAEHARLRELAADAPQEVVRELLGRRALEGGDVHAARDRPAPGRGRRCRPCPDVSMPWRTSSTCRLPPVRPSA